MEVNCGGQPTNAERTGLQSTNPNCSLKRFVDNLMKFCGIY